MGREWFLLGLVLLQGAIAISPIPTPNEADEEWESFATMLRDPAYRLPTTTRPTHYEVTLTPYFENVATGITPFTFDGEVTIYLNATEANINQIVMHCNDLTIYTVTVSTLINNVETIIPLNGGIPICEMPYSFLRIPLTPNLQMNQEYIVRISFLGNLQTNMRGFYRSWYVDTTGRRWMGTTQFQPGHARQAFPCYDEPGFKATFDITINREPDFSPTISNMPIRSNTTLSNGRISETFYTTPVTSTYLLAFIVSHYEVVSTTTNGDRPFDIYARDNANNTGDWSLEIGELLLDAMERYTNISYYDMAENMNMKQAAIPDFSAGAMENWGLLTYREALILYDPINSNHFYRQRVANIVSHEIAHMWFGNLVTCAWWDNLWLNEGFARFYQYYLTGSVAEDLGFPTRFIIEQLQISMFSDSLDTAHALTNPNVNDPTTVSAHFSTITYARGASVIRMTQHLLGESTFVSGLRAYLRERAYDVAEPQHLFDAWDAAAENDGTLAAYPDITISGYFKTWSEKAGHPLLTVIVNHSTGSMSVTQARWERTTGVSAYPSLWQIPITWTRRDNADFENLKPSQFLTEQVTFIDRGSTGLEWVIFNKQESGFYRVNYDWTTWGLITRALRGDDRNIIHEYNRGQIVDDVFALARAGVLPYYRAFNILSFLEFEDRYSPWYTATSAFNFLLRRLAHDQANLQLLRDYIIELSPAITSRLGYSEIANESYMDGLLRMYVMEFLCNIGHSECVQAGVSNFQNWKNQGTFIPPNMRPWVYCVGLREGTAEDYDFLWESYVNSDLASEKIVILGALGCTRDNSSIWSYMSEIVAQNDNIREQDYTTALNSAVSGNEENTLIAFEWLRNHVTETTTALGSIATPLSYIAARLLNEEQITSFETWLEENREEIGTAYNTGINGVQTTRNNLVWSAERIPQMLSYFDIGYVDDVEELEDSTTSSTTTTTTTTTQAPVTVDPVPDSANAFTFSFTLLIVSVLGFIVQ